MTPPKRANAQKAKRRLLDEPAAVEGEAAPSNGAGANQSPCHHTMVVCSRCGALRQARNFAKHATSMSCEFASALKQKEKRLADLGWARSGLFTPTLRALGVELVEGASEVEPLVDARGVEQTDMDARRLWVAARTVPYAPAWAVAIMEAEVREDVVRKRMLKEPGPRGALVPIAVHGSRAEPTNLKARKAIIRRALVDETFRKRVLVVLSFTNEPQRAAAVAELAMQVPSTL